MAVVVTHFFPLNLVYGEKMCKNDRLLDADSNRMGIVAANNEACRGRGGMSETSVPPLPVFFLTLR